MYTSKGTTDPNTSASTPNTGPTAPPGPDTVTPPHDSGLCLGPDGWRVEQSNQAQINFKPASSSELGVTKYDLNEVIHKSILFYEVRHFSVQNHKIKNRVQS